jgi:hypothetical protein
MKVAASSEALVTTSMYQTRRRHIQEDRYFHNHRHENLKSRTSVIFAGLQQLLVLEQCVMKQY